MTLPWYACFHQGIILNKRYIGKQEKHKATKCMIRMGKPVQAMKCGRSPSKSANHWYKPMWFKNCFNTKTIQQLWTTAWYWIVWADAKLLQLLLFFQIWLGGVSQSQAKATEFVRAQALSKQASKCLRKLAVVCYGRPSCPGASNSQKSAGAVSRAGFPNISQETFRARESVVGARSCKPRRKQFLAA